MPQLSLSAWWLLTAAVPVLLLGEAMITFIKPLAKFDLPASIVGGLLVAIAVLLVNVTRVAHLALARDITARPWNWIITPETKLKSSPANPVYLPFSTAFFCCVGLNASYSVAKKGSWQLLLFLALATVLGVLQNLLGVSMSRALHQNPLLGLICGSVTLTGGPSTALGFADTFQKAGFPAADAVGAAAAMFGIVTASLIAGAFGGQLIRLKWHGRPAHAQHGPEAHATKERQRITFLGHLKVLLAEKPATLKHLMVLLLCMKIGAWVSLFLKAHHIPLSVYMGGMILAVLFRNAADAFELFRFDTAIVQTLGTVFLGLFLTMAMASLNLLQLKTLAVPMLEILVAQVGLMLVFALGVTYILMGRDYDAAVMSAGHVGFGLGITPNAVATMDVLEQKFGLAPRAVLIVTVVGAFLIDFTNSLIITAHLNLLHR